MVTSSIQGLRLLMRAFALAVFFVSSLALAHGQSSIPAGTVISNRARVVYTEPDGGQAVTHSPVVTVTVAAVNGVEVTPDETASSGFVDANDTVAARFSVCNAGNTTTPFVISAASVTAPARIVDVYLDLDSSGAVSPGDSKVTLGVTQTPALVPGQCASVLLVYSVGAATAGSDLVSALTARTPDSAQGAPAQDDGHVVRTVKQGPIFSDPDNPQLPPRKSVNGVTEVTVGPNSTVDFEIAFRNVGQGRALAVRILDELPSGLTFVANSLKLTLDSQTTSLTDARDGDDGEVTGQTLEVRVPLVEAQQVVAVKFSARVEPLPAGTVLVNRALVSASNAREVYTRDTRVIIAPQGMVFDGGSGSTSPIERARVRVVSNDPQGPLVGLVPSQGFTPNSENANPFSTGADGLYSFRISTPQATSTYFILVEAEGFRPRSIEAVVSPRSEGSYDLHLRSRDGLPLCVAGGFSLTENEVEIQNLAAFVTNIPMFTSGDLQIAKAADRASAQIGDVVSYRVDVRNTARSTAYGVEVRDQLPQSFYYVPGTATLSVSGAPAQSIEPEITGAQLLFRIPSVPGGGQASLVYRVRIGANAHTGMQYNVAVASVGPKLTPPVRSGVMVKGGVFSTDQFIVGRVYADVNGNGRFDAGDRAIAGARLVTSSGRVVLTDSHGLYNIPVVADGALVIQLDSSSVPEGFVPQDRLRTDGSTWSRLIATPLLGGAMLQANFALVTPSAARAADAPSRGEGQGRGDESASSSGRQNDADSSSSAQSSVVSPPKKRRSWFKRFVSAFFNTSSGDNSNAKKQRVATASTASHQNNSSASTSPAAVAPPAPNAQAQIATTNAGDIVPAQYAVGVPMTTPTVTYSPAPASSPQPSPSPQNFAPSAAAPALPSSGGTGGAGASSAGVARVNASGIEVDVEPDSVSMKHGFDVPVRVAHSWNVHLYLNDVLVDSTRVGERREDEATQTDQFTFIGLALQPGPNRLRAVAVTPDGQERAMREILVYGRGPAKQISIVSEVREIASGGRERAALIVKALDEWGHAAEDGDVVLETNLGALSLSSSGEEMPAAEDNAASASTVRRASAASNVSQVQKQLPLHLRGGSAVVYLVSAPEPGTARVTVSSAQGRAETEVRFGVEHRPLMMVGYGQLTVGRNAPVMVLRGVDGHTLRGSLGFFFRGVVRGQTLTLAYDSSRPLQRYDARDRMFQTDPLDNAYPVFGDSSTRFNAAASNTKVFARLDLSREYGRSFLQFGDYIPEQHGNELAAYSRRITGGEVHFENSHGDFIDFGGAHPDTLYGRDVFAGGLFGFERLSQTLLLAGTESVTLEVRDRRNPDIVLKREQLVRGLDYNLDADAGLIFFTRSINAFDPELNLQQVVVTYEYLATGVGTMIWTARGTKTFRSTGTTLGFSANLQQQGSLGNFALGGLDFSQKIRGGGLLHLEWARSTGQIAVTGTYTTGSDQIDRQGNAYLATYDQPFKWHQARLQASFRRAGAGFYNPFGGTVVAGAQRAGVALEMQTVQGARLRMGFVDERNRTETVNNSRQTVGFSWTQRINERMTATFGYDFRHFQDENATTGTSAVTDSHMVTAGLDWRPTDRLSLSVRREQNLAKSDPTYPNQTVLSASYRLNDTSRLFITQALRSAPISPINDLAGVGFGLTSSRREMTAGIETKFLRDTSLIGGYRIESGLDGSDGYAVLGLARKWKLSSQLALDASFERAFHVRGNATGGYNTLAGGLTWHPREDFIANASYQWRTRDGHIHTLAAGFTGKPFSRVTAIGSFQWSRGFGTDSVGSPRADNFDPNNASGAGAPALGLRGFRQGMYGSLGVALRPLDTDRFAAFLNFQHRSFAQSEAAGASSSLSRERASTLSADAFFRALPKLTLFGKVAARAGNSSRSGLASSPTLTYLLQGRAEYSFAPRWDFALESRYLAQPVTHTSHTGLASEIGFWATPDLRLGLGYNFNRAIEQPGRDTLGGDRRGFYFSISTKFERMFDFMGARRRATAEPGPDR